ncbi:MAG: hypothetical protein HYV09_14385 [Deltaproteobacteria bacterium]|nr:hypothetical protein [Deltaproteobacteria bacterium]
MKVAVVGAGALGSVYGVNLSRVADVTFVVRDLSRAPRVMHVERVTGPAHAHTLDAPRFALDVPRDADVVLVAVRVDQLDDALLAKLAREAAGDALVVILAPLLPHRWEHAHEKLGARLVAAMPGVVAYEPEVHDGAGPIRRGVRYWTPRASPTFLDDRPHDDPGRARLLALVDALRRVEIPAEPNARVRSLNPATTIAFFPMLTGIAAAGGSIDRMLADAPLMKLGLAAAKETRALARTLGELPPWASLFFNFMSPFTVRAGIKLGRARAPEVFTFLEKHFGQKLLDQNMAIFHEIERLAAERGVAIDHLRKLVARAHP